MKTRVLAIVAFVFICATIFGFLQPASRALAQGGAAP